MATPTIDIVKKLMELALHNPNEEEARSAAMQAIKLIDRHSLPVGDNVIHRPTADWVPPPPDFYETVADILRGQGKDPDKEADAYNQPYQGPEAGIPLGQTAGLTFKEQELEDSKSAFARQVVVAWRAIRETRAKLQSEIYEWEQRTRMKFHDRGW